MLCLRNSTAVSRVVTRQSLNMPMAGERSSGFWRGGQTSLSGVAEEALSSSGVVRTPETVSQVGVRLWTAIAMVENVERDHGVAAPYTLTPFPSPSGRGV